MKKYAYMGVLISLLVMCLLLPTTSAHAVLVKYVHDGDTITLVNGEIIRILDIDAPEMLQKPFGKESGAFLRNLIKGKDVTIVYQYDVKGNRIKDDYGRRYLAHVFYAGVDVGLLMIKEGQAFVYRKCTDEAYKTALQEAQRMKKGFWGSTSPPMDPYLFRRSIKSTYGAK